MPALSRAELAQKIDYPLLRPEYTVADILAGCARAKEYGVWLVSVKPCYTALTVLTLAGSGVRTGSVVGFPHGSSVPAVKAAEARCALDAGAVEIDMVINIGALRSGQMDLIEEEIFAVVAGVQGRALVKVILETCYLTDEQKVLGCQATERAGADFVKTSSGFAPSGATLADVRLMRASVGPTLQVKAAGGIRTLAQLLALHEAGAVRFGTSSAFVILDESGRAYS